MAKPATLPRWATDLTNNDAPSSGQMDTGWTPGQTGVSDYDNYIKYWTYKWCQYLDAGIFAGNVTFEGSVTVGGVLTAQNNVQVDLELTVTGQVFFENKVNFQADWTYGEKRRGYSIRDLKYMSATGTGSYGITSGGIETYTFSTAVTKALCAVEDMVPGDRLKKVRLCYETAAGTPTVTPATHDGRLWATGTPLTTGTPLDIGGGLWVTEYTVEGVNLYTLRNDIQAYDWAEPQGIIVTVGTDNTIIRGIEVRWDRPGIP